MQIDTSSPVMVTGATGYVAGWIVRDLLEAGVTVHAPVRDLSRAHIAAAYLPDAEGRHIVSGHNITFPEMAGTLIDKYGKDYPIPRRTVPKWLIWIMAPMVNKGMTRKMVSRNMGYPWIADNSKSKRALGMTYRPVKETMTDFFQQMIDSGAFGEG